MIWTLFRRRQSLGAVASVDPGQSISTLPLRKITVRNETDSELFLSIEVIPDGYRIPAGAKVEVVGRELRCNPDGSLDVTQYKDNFLVLWLDDAEVFHNGRKLKAYGEPLEYE